MAPGKKIVQGLRPVPATSDADREFAWAVGDVVEIAVAGDQEKCVLP
jgi:hypothetical protein